MEVLRPLKELYSGKNAISNHVTLFSILGIVVILLNNVVVMLFHPFDLFV